MNASWLQIAVWHTVERYGKIVWNPYVWINKHKRYYNRCRS